MLVLGVVALLIFGVVLDFRIITNVKAWSLYKIKSIMIEPLHSCCYKISFSQSKRAFSSNSLVPTECVSGCPICAQAASWSADHGPQTPVYKTPLPANRTCISC